MDAAYSYSISLRADRPVAECDFSIHPYLSLKGGNVDNATRAKIMDANPYRLAFKWFRANSKLAACANAGCPRKNSFEPMMWTKFSRKGPGVRCAVCERLGIVPSVECTFCSISCFKQAWKGHNLSYHSSCNKARSNSDYIDDAELGSNNLLSANDDSPLTPFEDAVDWQLVSTEKIFVPSAADVGFRLRAEVTAYAANGDSVLAGPVSITSEPVLSSPVGPPKRSLLTIAGAAVGTSSAVARFRIISYNVLSELYATKQAYPYCDSWSLLWSYRRNLILQELLDSQGDLICLQEVQADHFEQFLKPSLADNGYDGLFRQKSRESMGQQGKVDGCAIFWKRLKFAVTESHNVDFNECALRTSAALGMDDGDTRRYVNRLSKDNIAQIVLLEVLVARATAPQRNSRQIICLANTHLYSNYQRPDVKLWQTLTLIVEIERLIISRDIPLILCGDFNSEPESAVYELLVKGRLENPHPELDHSDSHSVLPQIQSIQHRIELASMMTAATSSEPEFTNYTGKFKGTLDYIFYSPSRLRVLAVETIPNAAEIENSSGEGLPSACFPSDHVHLCCDVALLSQGTGSLTRSAPREHLGGFSQVGGEVYGDYNDFSRGGSSKSGKYGFMRR